MTIYAKGSNCKTPLIWTSGGIHKTRESTRGAGEGHKNRRIIPNQLSAKNSDEGFKYTK